MTVAARSPVLPEAPVLAAGFAGAGWLDIAGEVSLLAPADAARRVASAKPILCHGPATARRLGIERFAGYDLLQLFAFVRPARFCLPTPRGLCEALDLGVPTTPEEEAACLPEAARALLDELEDMAALASPEMKDTALAMARGQWAWGEEVL